MDFDPEPFQIGWAILHWLLVLLAVSVVGLFVAGLVSIAAMGLSGPKFVLGQIGRTLKGFAGAFTSGGLRRVTTVASLTLKEAIRRKALWIFAIFAALFMFAGWFLGSATIGSDRAAEPYVTFVLTTISLLSLPLAILLSCWGLPQDIKARSLHTVVTKPVRRVEIVMGRMLGYSLVTAIVVGVMAAVGYVWIKRTVPERAQQQLIGRVPVYGELTIIGRDGRPGEGINVGDIWEYRGYVEGNSQGRGIYEFDELPLGKLRDMGELPVEYDFEIFRTVKGDVVTGVRAQFTLINDRGTEDESDDLRVDYPEVAFEVKEFTDSVSEAVQSIPRELTGPDGQPVDLFKVAAEPPPPSDDPNTAVPDGLIAPDGSLTISVRCIDRNQYLGVARRDLFVRMPDKPFVVSYAKAAFGILLQAIVLVILGTTASCIVKGPVATFLTLGLFLMGMGSVRDYASNELFKTEADTNVANGVAVLGGGPIESVYRLVTQMNQTTQIPDSTSVRVMKKVDTALLGTEKLVLEVVPDLRPFSTADYLKKGFDIPWSTSTLPALATTLGFLIPCIILGALCLQMRELEAK